MRHFRHRFATKTLVRWYRSGQDPERRLPLLSAYLGHVHVADTQWYLEASPELMREAMQRLQQRQASPHTIGSYRDTFRQFLKFTEQRFHKAPSLLTFQEINAPLIVAF